MCRICFFVGQYNISFGCETSYRKLPLDKAKYTLGKGNIFICKSKQKNCFYLGEAKYTFGEARFHFNSIEHETKQRKLALGK
jgi:hypothetical protein